MLAPGELEAALAKSRAAKFDGFLYRAIHLEALFGFRRVPPHPAPRPLYSLGAPAAGARYTPRNGPASLYLAESADTAYAEANPVDPSLPRRPTVVISARVRLEAVLDLLAPEVLEPLGLAPAALVAPWRLSQDRGELSPTQLLGQAVFASSRFQAIRYPSARVAGAACVVIFTERLTDPASVEVYDPDGNLRQRLP